MNPNNRSPRLLLATMLALSLVACATPIQQSTSAMTTYDRDTEYSITDRPDGFALAINYSRYQFIPESTAVAQACKSALTSLAHELADRKGKKLKPIDEQRIRLSLGRNGLTGITSCSASAVVEWV
jgi:hypothetical protein